MKGARGHVVFFLNGQRCSASGSDVFRTVSEYLRERRGLVGTKIVCSEGDCGSCTVLVGTADGDRLSYRPIDSCIRFVFQLDGTHLVTVEGLAAAGQLTPAQQAMIDCHGSQCGFCTPGFVMAMTGVGEEHAGQKPPEEIWREGLSGNLCRCTGYTQILEACEQATDAEWPPLEERYPSGAILETLAPDSAAAFDVSADDGRRVYSPVDLDDALRFRQQNPGCTVVAGATDLGVQRNKGRLDPRVCLDLRRVHQPERSIVLGDHRRLAISATATWTDLLVWSRRELPEFAKILAVFGSPQIRHAGTMGGNLVNASPIADSLPLLYVLRAQLILRSTGGRRVVDIADFYRGYKQLDLQPTELLAEVVVPLPEPKDMLRLYKVSRRKDMDISTFTAAILMKLEGESISEAHLAYGAVGPTVLRLPRTEATLIGKSFSAETMRGAGEIAAEEISPISDVRGAAEYRRQLARNVLLKFHAEHQAGVLQETG